MSPRLTCGGCRHWLRAHPFGTCKRYPPTPLAAQQWSPAPQALPHTGPDDWCGEAAPIESPEA